MKLKTGLKTTTVLQVNSVIKMKNILFVCTGNTCRSPMAEALFNHIYGSDDIKASSRGIYADGISQISKNAKQALWEKGIDFNHTSKPLLLEDISNADYVVGITANHAKNIISLFPDFADKVFAMPIDISDPYGQDIDVYRECRDQIELCVKIIAEALNGEGND